MMTEYPPEILISLCQIRWLIRRDMDDILRIENESYEYPWTEEEFLCCLRQRNCIGAVLELEHQIIGFMIYELHKGLIRILNFTVDPAYRRKGLGTMMANRLIEKLPDQLRSSIVLEIRERNVDGQLFFSKMGFKAVQVLKRHYDDTDEDAYLMEYSIR